MQGYVSYYYSSTTSPLYVSSSQNMQMDGRTGHISATYPANYSQTSSATPHVNNFSMPYVDGNSNDSASYLTYDHSRISEISAGMHMPSSIVV